MRIIAGTAKGRKITVPKGPTVRPTTDRVREALFSHLGHRVAGARVLDLFAGSGALGLEALSRGASSAVFLEKSKKTALNLFKNIETLGFSAESTVKLKDSISFLRGESESVYDLIFLDPPYDSDLLAKSMELINKTRILDDSGIIVAEHPDGRPPGTPDNLKMINTRKYGNTSITTFEWLNR